MHKYLVLGCLILAGCAQPGVPQPQSQSQSMALVDQITNRDMMMNRPNTDRREARFRMLSNGRGTVEFLNGATGPQSVGWTIDGNRFCIVAAEGLMASFDCATLNITGSAITLAHTASDSVVSGVLVAR